MIEIRRRVVNGDSYYDIQQELNLNRRTFYRYLQRVFEEDNRALKRTNGEEVLLQAAIAKERFNEIYQILKGIATSPQDYQNVTAEDRLAACHAMASLSQALIHLYQQAPAYVAAQKRKLLAIKRQGELSEIGKYQQQNNGRLPPILQFPLSLPPQPPSSAAASDPLSDQQE